MSRRGKPQSLSLDERRGIQSIEVGAIILNVIAAFPRASTLKEISDASEMPSSKIHRYLSSFMRAGLIKQDSRTGLYDLGPIAVQIGLSAIARFDIVDEAVKHMANLTEETGATSLLSVWTTLGPIIIRWQRGAENVVTSLGLGSVLPTTRSATGHAFLAYLPEALVRKRVADSLRETRKMDISGPRTKKELAIILDGVRQRGYAAVSGTTIPGLQAAAIPILDMQGQTAAVITVISGMSNLCDPETGMIDDLIKTAKAASVI